MEQLLIERAREACSKAYVPYSSYAVGVSVLTYANQIYTGCNIENVSHGLTVCAERNAVFQAVSSDGPTMRLKGIAVVSARGGDCAPCGACRQVLTEFDQGAVVFNRFKGGGISLADLLPAAFSFEPSFKMSHS